MNDPAGRRPPRLYFADGAFRGVLGKPKSFDFLLAMCEYINSLFVRKKSAALASSLYEPFRIAFNNMLL